MFYYSWDMTHYRGGRSSARPHLDSREMGVGWRKSQLAQKDRHTCRFAKEEDWFFCVSSFGVWLKCFVKVRVVHLG